MGALHVAESTLTSELERIPRSSFLGVDVHVVNMDRAVRVCRDAVESRESLVVGVVNAAKIVKMQDDPVLRESVTGADLVIADGMAVVWASRILAAKLPERVPGIDLFTRLLELSNERRLGVYFLGAKPEVLETVVSIVRERYPNLRVAGHRDGYFKEDEEEEVANEIRDSKADFLFIGITTPKKENFMGRWWTKMGVPVCHGVGGSFDVMAGVVKRAPETWQKLGLEWFYRFVQEPRRMWKRYLVTNTRFIAMVLREWFGKRRPRG
jgi:N-acetylglucosaminyldiphosphoundecaprenol N-acetyl-beta-D-mannosaminyltransferase